jgi:hypothetical protein
MVYKSRFGVHAQQHIDEYMHECMHDAYVNTVHIGIYMHAYLS